MATIGTIQETPLNQIHASLQPPSFTQPAAAYRPYVRQSRPHCRAISHPRLVVFVLPLKRCRHEAAASHHSPILLPCRLPCSYSRAPLFTEKCNEARRHALPPLSSHVTHCPTTSHGSFDFC
ncbi:putative serine/threonine-protein kinase [Sesbania bispinosa]|nr:putative serine/threonine-protein kinase [Sesbania bispinosa]